MKRHIPVLPVSAILLTCYYPCIFTYLKNVGEARLVDIFPMLGLFALTGLILFGLAWLVLRRADAAGLFSSVSMLILTNSGLVGDMLKSKLPWFRDRYMLLAVAVLMVAVFLLLLRKKKFPARDCCKIVVILFAALTVVQTVPVVPTIYKILSFREPELEYMDTAFEGDRPNVYLFLLDEYGGGENLRRYYDFDNEEFLSFLEENRFNISDSSKNTESIWTSTLVPNLLNLGYHVEDRQPERVKFRYMDDPLLARIFRENGYQVNVISHEGFIGDEAGNVLSGRQYPERIGAFILENSVFNQIPPVRRLLEYRMGIQNYIQQAEVVEDIFDCMRTCTEHLADGPTLTLSYVKCPHYPFLFDEDGAVIDGGRNIMDQSIYLGQLRYVNQILTESIEAILEKDPDSIVVIQADHGTRYPGQMLLYYGEPDYDPYLETPYMQNIINCVYYRGQPLAIEGETGINTWRMILREAFGMELAPLTPPEGYTCYGKSWADKPKDFGR